MTVPGPEAEESGAASGPAGSRARSASPAGFPPPLVPSFLVGGCIWGRPWLSPAAPGLHSTHTQQKESNFPKDYRKGWGDSHGAYRGPRAGPRSVAVTGGSHCDRISCLGGSGTH